MSFWVKMFQLSGNAERLVGHAQKLQIWNFGLVNHGVPKPPLVNFVKLMIIGFDIVVN